MNVTLKAKIVWVKIEEGDAGLYFATSPELKGLLVAESSLEDLEREIPKAIQDLYAACGESVVVTSAEDGTDDLHPWVAVPAEIARRALSVM